MCVYMHLISEQSLIFLVSSDMSIILSCSFEKYLLFTFPPGVLFPRFSPVFPNSSTCIIQDAR